MEPMKPMAPMRPMAPMQPMEGVKPWWPRDLGDPSTTGSQNGLRYAYFSDKKRLLIDTDGSVATYDSGEHEIRGVAQDGGGSAPRFESQNGVVSVGDLKKLS